MRPTDAEHAGVTARTDTSAQRETTAHTERGTHRDDRTTVRARLEQVWGEETAAPGSFDAARISTGQCAVSALYLQAICGGELLRTMNAPGGEPVSHYWNRLPDGSEVDLTRDQFRVWAPTQIIVRSRAYLEAHPDTMTRYQVLLQRLDALSGAPGPCGHCPYCQGVPAAECPEVGTRCWETLWVRPDDPATDRLAWEGMQIH